MLCFQTMPNICWFQLIHTVAVCLQTWYGFTTEGLTRINIRNTTYKVEILLDGTMDGLLSSYPDWKYLLKLAALSVL